MVDCINAHQPPLEVASRLASIAQYKLSALRVAHAWWSRRPAAGPLTLTTMLSMERLGQLRAQCRAWAGPLSAVVYLPVPISDPQGHDPDRAWHAAGAVLRAAATPNDTEQVTVGHGTHGLVHDEHELKDLPHPVQQAALALRNFHFEMDHGAAQAGAGGGTADGGGGSGAREAAKAGMRIADLRASNGASTKAAGTAQQPTPRCQLDVMLAWELVEAAVGSDASMLFPMNILRNYARLQARTEYIAWLDIDMMPSIELHQAACANSPTWRSIAARLNGIAFAGLQPMPSPAATSGGPSPSQHLPKPHFVVLPAFDYIPKPDPPRQSPHWLPRTVDEDRILAGGRPAAVAAAGDSRLVKFGWPDRHDATRYDRWLSLDTNTSEGNAGVHGYEIQFHEGYEPWGILHRRTAPFADARFRGYCCDKLIYLEHFHALNYTFLVHPTAFILHRAHTFTTANKQASQSLGTDPATNITMKSNGAYDYELYTDETKAMQRGRYQPVLDPATVACSRRLSWWQ